MKTISWPLSLALFFGVVIFAAIAIKGSGFPLYFQNEKDTRIAGPFETSNNTARYALTESIVLNQSLFLNEELAAFSSPDLSKINGKYLSIFTPGVSFLGIPFYYIGSKLGLAQIATYLLSSTVSVLNVYLISWILRRFGINKYIGLLSGAIFLFATNAYSYSNSFNQHHISTAILLISIILLMTENFFMSNLFFSIIFGAALIVDIPNAFILLPLLIDMFAKNFFIVNEIRSIIIKGNPAVFGLVIGAIPFLILFGLYNHTVTGNYFKLGQISGRYIYSSEKTIDAIERVGEKVKKDFHQFDTRRLLSGLTVLTVSPDRGLFIYSPILVFGIIGIIVFDKKQFSHLRNTLLSTILINLILYAFFNDPWGGWAFGPRYLIPSAAVLSIFAGLAIDRYLKNVPVMIGLVLTLLYSVYVNTLGALTTQLVPSSVQLPFLTEKGLSDNFTYNYSFLEKNVSSSMVYNAFLKNSVGLGNFVVIVSTAIIIFLVIIYLLARKSKASEQAI